jgi:chromosome segregation ATPase
MPSDKTIGISSLDYDRFIKLKRGWSVRGGGIPNNNQAFRILLDERDKFKRQRDNAAALRDQAVHEVRVLLREKRELEAQVNNGTRDTDKVHDLHVALQEKLRQSSQQEKALSRKLNIITEQLNKLNVVVDNDGTLLHMQDSRM